MDVIEILMAEHRHILRVVGAMDRAADAVRNGHPPDAELHGRAIDFIRRYVDDVHHAKEERGLFAVMAAAGLPIESSPVGCMLRQHVRGRQLVARMDVALGPAAKGSTAARDELLEASIDYGRMITAHILVEDERLYPFARVVVPAEMLADLSVRVGSGAEAELAAFAEAAAVIERLAPRARSADDRA